MKFYNNIDAFIAVYRLKSFTKAAKQLDITQASVSIQVKKLEHYFGKKLFERNGKNIVATEEAESLVALVAEHFDNIDSILINFTRYSNSMNGVIKIGCLNEIAQIGILPKIGECLEKGIKIIINYFNTDEEIKNALLNNMIDFGLLTTFYNNNVLNYHNLFKDQLVLIGTNRWENYLDKRSPESIYESLKSLRWLAYDNNLTFIKPYIEKAFNKRCSFVKPHLIFNELNALLSAVANGYGVTVLPKSYISTYVKEDTINQIDFPSLLSFYNISLVYKTRSLLNKRVKFFKETILKENSSCTNSHIDPYVLEVL